MKKHCCKCIFVSIAVFFLIAVTVIGVYFSTDGKTIVTIANAGAIYGTVLGVVITITMICVAVDAYSHVARIRQMWESLRDVARTIHDSDEGRLLKNISEQSKKLERLKTETSTLSIKMKDMVATMTAQSGEANRLAVMMSATVIYSSWQYMKSDDIRACLMDLQVNGSADDAGALESWLNAYKQHKPVPPLQLATYHKRNAKYALRKAISNRSKRRWCPDPSVIDMAERAIERLKQKD